MVTTKSTKKDFHCELTNGIKTVESDAPTYKGGLGNGFRPHELLEGALASCLSITIRMIANEKNIKLESVITQVDIDKTNDKTTFKYKILLDDNLNAEDRKFLISVIDSCAVKQTLSKQLEFKVDE